MNDEMKNEMKGQMRTGSLCKTSRRTGEFTVQNVTSQREVYLSKHHEAETGSRRRSSRGREGFAVQNVTRQKRVHSAEGEEEGEEERALKDRTST